MAKKQSTKKKAAGRRVVPHALIAKMVQEGADALTIAKKIGRVNEGSDKTHTVRALISGLRSKGWRDENGKLHKLKIARVGQPKQKAVKKAVKKASKKSASKPTTAAPTEPDGTTEAAGKEK